MRIAFLIAVAQPLFVGGKLRVVRSHSSSPYDNDGYEYGDMESSAGETDDTDYSVHQFLAKDEARDPMGSDDVEEDAAQNDADRSRILSKETFDSEDTPADDSFLQIASKTRYSDDDEFEYGDEAESAGETDDTDYSVHQFLVKDEARDEMGSDDAEEDVQKNNAERSKILASRTFDAEDTPAGDSFLQKRSEKKRAGFDDDDSMEYGDEANAAGETDDTDYSVHQFMAKDEARDAMGSDDAEEDVASNNALRSKILARRTFDSEDTPAADDDSFFQKKSQHNKKQPMEDGMEYGDQENAAGDTDNTDYSVHQFLVKDEARDPMGSDDGEEDAAQNDADRSKILSKEAFDSEDEPAADDSFLQKRSKRHRKQPMEDGMEYGDQEAAAGETDTTDYSVHQFLAKDEARDPMGSDDDEDDAAQNDADRSRILSKETFDSEDSPADDN